MRFSTLSRAIEDGHLHYDRAYGWLNALADEKPLPKTEAEHQQRLDRIMELATELRELLDTEWRIVRIENDKRANKRRWGNEDGPNAAKTQLWREDFMAESIANQRKRREAMAALAKRAEANAAAKWDA